MDDSQAPPGRLDARYRAFLETIATLRPKLHRYCARMTGSTFDGEDVVPGFRCRLSDVLV